MQMRHDCYYLVAMGSSSLNAVSKESQMQLINARSNSKVTSNKVLIISTIPSMWTGAVSCWQFRVSHFKARSWRHSDCESFNKACRLEHMIFKCCTSSERSACCSLAKVFVSCMTIGGFWIGFIVFRGADSPATTQSSSIVFVSQSADDLSLRTSLRFFNPNNGSIMKTKREFGVRLCAMGLFMHEVDSTPEWPNWEIRGPSCLNWKGSWPIPVDLSGPQ